MYGGQQSPAVVRDVESCAHGSDGWFWDNEGGKQTAMKAAQATMTVAKVYRNIDG